MHAVVHTATIVDAPGSRGRLHDEVVPRVSHLPGFVRGTWAADLQTGSSVAFVLFETREAADAVAASLRDPSHRHDEIRTNNVDVFEVVAEA
jgi:hypothetical protein